MDVVTFLTSNLKTRCIWFQPCINVNGETQECEVVFNHNKLVIKNLHGVVLFEPYLFEVERITDILFNCSHYNKEKNLHLDHTHHSNFVYLQCYPQYSC